MSIVIISALLPVVILISYIYWRDKNSPEPTKMLVKAFLYGVLSIFLSLCLSIPFGILGLYPNENITVFDAIRQSFIAAAIPEESAKLFMLWLLLRKNSFFDEKIDGIVYASFVSLGFAAVENIMYLSSSENFVTTSVTRALFSVPGHFSFGILMGYFYSMARFYTNNKLQNLILSLVAPVIAHGLFNTILRTVSVSTSVSVQLLLLVVFITFCYALWKFANKRIKEMIDSNNTNSLY